MGERGQGKAANEAFPSPLLGMAAAGAFQTPQKAKFNKFENIGMKSGKIREITRMFFI